MKFQPLPIYGGSYADDTKSWSAQDVLGWLPSNAEVPGTKTEGMFKTPPGLRPFAEVPPTGGGEDPLIPSPPVRGAWNAEGKMFVVIGTTFYQLSNAGVFIPIGTIPGTGRVIFSHNQVSLGNQVLAVNGSAGYIYDTRDQTFQRITDPGYPGAFVATFIDGYFVQISANRRFAFNSDVANGLEYNTLDRFTSEFSPDLLVSLVASNNELFLLSETSGEFFENTGAAQQPFRSKRITMDRGCAGAYTVAKADNTVFWLGNNGYFYVLNGYAPQRISTRAIEQSILGKNWKQCFAFAWEDAGHTVIYWTFPDGLTWGYDTSTGLWHRRESYGLNRWRINTMTFWNQEWYAGDFQYGRIWKMDWNYTLEGDQEFPSERTTAVIHDNQNRIIIPRLELLMQVGQEETIPLDFPVQPDSPTISGNAPDGSVGVAWGPYSYTLAGGTPPYVVTLRPGGILPDGIGPLSSAGVIAAGVPGEIETQDFTVRVTDANGLWDEVDDTITIGTMMLALAELTSGSNTLASSGTDWSGAFSQGVGMLGFNRLVGTDTNFISYYGSGAHRPIYTSNFGASWTEGVGDDYVTSGGPKLGWYDSGSEVMLLPQGLTSGFLRSLDKGVNWEQVGAKSTYATTKLDTRWLSVDNATHGISYSEDDGDTWSTEVILPDVRYTLGIARWSYNGIARFGGSDAAGTEPRIVSTGNGTSFSLETLPVVTGIVINCMCAGSVNGVATWVAATDEGEILYKSGSNAWALSPSTMGCYPGGAVYNGIVFTMVGGDQSKGDVNGIIKTSPDGIVWTTRKTLALGVGDSIKDIAVMGMT